MSICLIQFRVFAFFVKMILILFSFNNTIFRIILSFNLLINYQIYISFFYYISKCNIFGFDEKYGYYSLFFATLQTSCTIKKKLYLTTNFQSLRSPTKLLST